MKVKGALTTARLITGYHLAMGLECGSRLPSLVPRPPIEIDLFCCRSSHSIVFCYQPYLHTTLFSGQRRYSFKKAICCFGATQLCLLWLNFSPFWIFFFTIDHFHPVSVWYPIGNLIGLASNLFIVNVNRRGKRAKVPPAAAHRFHEDSRSSQVRIFDYDPSLSLTNRRDTNGPTTECETDNNQYWVANRTTLSPIDFLRIVIIGSFSNWFCWPINR